ncbi:MAG: hypothetical protein JW986_05460 [Methanotrichaceae archaeon]|nr:hypothetical protein [Methanotrichaceae archaeon]
MSRICLFALFGAFLLSIQGCGAIEMGFSMDTGSGEMGVDCQYTLGDDFSFDESLSADPVEGKVTDRKEVSGEGDLDLVQSFQSSGGDSGQSRTEAEGAGRVQLASESRIDQEGISLKQTGGMAGDYGNMVLSVRDKDGTNARVMTVGRLLFTAGLEADQSAGTDVNVFAYQTSKASGMNCLAITEAWWDEPGNSRGTSTWVWANGNLEFQGGARGDSQLLESYKSSWSNGLAMVHGSVAGNYLMVNRDTLDSFWWFLPGYSHVRSMNDFIVGTGEAVSQSWVDKDVAVNNQMAWASGWPNDDLYNQAWALSGEGIWSREDNNAPAAVLYTRTTPTTSDAEVI